MSLDFLETDLKKILTSPMAEEIICLGSKKISFSGFFSAPGELVNPSGASAPIILQNFTIFFQGAALAKKPERNDIFIARGERFKAIKITGDGQGLLTIALHRVG